MPQPSSSRLTPAGEEPLTELLTGSISAAEGDGTFVSGVVRNAGSRLGGLIRRVSQDLHLACLALSGGKRRAALPVSNLACFLGSPERHFWNPASPAENLTA